MGVNRVQRTVFVEGRDALLPSLLRYLRACWLSALLVEEGSSVLSCAERDDVTPVGFDVGESKLLVGCALRDNTPVDPLFVDGGRVRHLRQKQASAEDRLKPRYASKLLDDLVWGRWQDTIEDEIEKASARAVEYTVQFENPVIVLEYLDGITDKDIGKYWNRRLGKWLFSQL